MTIYIAAKYPRRDEMRHVRTKLQIAGFTVTSRWLDETTPLDSTLPESTPRSCQRTAIIDLEDVDRADTFLFFSEDSLVGVPRGGRHVEMGFALAKGKRIIVIGDPENIFHYLPGIIHYPTLDSFLEWESFRHDPATH
jgi:nucleoside 2-deoxyribosyltransferase